MLLISFAIDIQVAKSTIALHRRRAVFFASVAVEFMTALAFVLSWVALWSPAAWEKIKDLLVFIPRSIAVMCVVILTVEKTPRDRHPQVASRARSPPAARKSRQLPFDEA